jgi:glycosyltransferase involved in cell wall biosynthesis
MRVLVDTIHSSSTGAVGRRFGYRVTNWIPDKITAVSQASADSWSGARMVSLENLLVLPNGIDTDHWKPDPTIREEMLRKLGLEGGFLWIAVGRLEPVKDYPLLLRAMAGLPSHAVLAIAGGGSLENVLRKQSTELGLRDRVRFLGFESRVLPWLLAADGFVLCSKWEGLPLALLESGACGLPAVVTDVAGIREVVADSQGSVLVSPGNVESLRAGMMQVMLMCPSERNGMGLRLRQAVVERFNINSVLDKWEALYVGLLAKNPQPMRMRRTHAATEAGLTQAVPIGTHKAESLLERHSHR